MLRIARNGTESHAKPPVALSVGPAGSIHFRRRTRNSAVVIAGIWYGFLDDRWHEDRPYDRHRRYNTSQHNINPIIGLCVVLVSCDHSFSERSHSVDVPGATGLPEAERPQGRKRPAQVKSDGEPKSTRRPRREPRPVWSRLHCLKPNPERMINSPAATLTLRRRVSGAGENRLIVGKTARCSDRGDEPGSRDEWAT
jgi:hypothetical protein